MGSHPKTIKNHEAALSEEMKYIEQMMNDKILLSKTHKRLCKYLGYCRLPGYSAIELRFSAYPHSDEYFNITLDYLNLLGSIASTLLRNYIELPEMTKLEKIIYDIE